MLECAQATADFYQFVNEVYKGLYRIESRVNGGKSPLSVFCRIDIGLIESGNREVCSRYKYFKASSYIFDVRS